MSETGCNCCCHRRLSWSALEDAVPSIRGVTGYAIAKRFGVHPQLAYKWRARDWVSIEQAEMITDALGIEPDDVWPEYMELAAA